MEVKIVETKIIVFDGLSTKGEENETFSESNMSAPRYDPYCNCGLS